MPEIIKTEDVVAAINGQQLGNLQTAQLSTPYGGYCNGFGLVLYGNTISWDGFGRVRVTYNAVKIEYLRRTVYRSMPVAQYMSDDQLLHHYFCYLTPANLLYDAALHVSELPEGMFAINQN